jgi:hypothetical protein
MTSRTEQELVAVSMGLLPAIYRTLQSWIVLSRGSSVEWPGASIAYFLPAEISHKLRSDFADHSIFYFLNRRATQGVDVFCTRGYPDNEIGSRQQWADGSGGAINNRVMLGSIRSIATQSRRCARMTFLRLFYCSRIPFNAFCSGNSDRGTAKSLGSRDLPNTA